MTHAPAEHAAPANPPSAARPREGGGFFNSLKNGIKGLLYYGIAWPVIQTAKLTRNAVGGAVEGVITGTFGTVGGGFKGAAKQISETAHGVQESINEAKHQWTEAKNIAKLAAPINALIGVTAKLAMGALQLPVSMIEGAVEKPPEGISKVVSGLKPWDLDRKRENSRGAHAAEAHAGNHGGGHG